MSSETISANTEFKFEIGEIVSLKTNFLKAENHFSNIWLAGEPNYVTPLMIVIEVLTDPKKHLDEQTGEIKINFGKTKYKCIWFSNKKNKLEVNWFTENELDKVIKDINALDDFVSEDLVILKTNSLEISKRKSLFEMDNFKNSKKTTPLLTFTSPVFIVVGFMQNDYKESLLDKHLEIQKRWISEKLAKVKFYNLIEEKYSEILIPMKALEKIEKIDESILNKLTNAKKDKKYCILKIKEDSDSMSTGFYSINSIIYISGLYKLELTNLFNQNTIEINLQDIIELDDLVISGNDNTWPRINDIPGSFTITSVLEYLEPLSDLFFKKNPETSVNVPMVDNLFHIYYKNKYEKYTNRYIVPIYVKSIISKTIIKDKEKDKEEHYLKAFCLLRSEYRYFKVDRIQSLEVVNSSEMFNLGMELWNRYTSEI